MKIVKICSKLLCVLALGLLIAVLLQGQQETGSIIGTVQDPSGLGVAGAEVNVRNQDTAAMFRIITDATGLWRAPQLGPGKYEISVMAKGFSTLIRKDVEVRVADRLRLDLGLQVGAVSETINVTASAPLLQVEDAAVGQVVDNRKIVELPLNGRNWMQLATLAPATVSFSNTAAAGSLNVAMNIGGLRSAQTQFLLDGADNSNLIFTGATFNPPVDALQEFKVQSNNFSADTAGFSGAVLNATIKSGTNTFHGNAYDFLRNRSLNARNFFALPTQPKPQFTRNQYGGTIGGPFVKNKLLFFLNYDGTRQRQASTSTTTVFNAAQKAGIFSGAPVASGTDASGNPVYAGTIYDPASLQILPNGTALRSPFPGNVIPANRINPTAQKLINLTPAPNVPGTPLFSVNIGAPVNIDAFLGRVDWIRSDKNTVFSHIGYTDQSNTTNCLFGLPLCGGTGNGGPAVSGQRQATAGWTHIFSPNLINEARAGFSRYFSKRGPFDADTDVNSQYGVPFPFQGPQLGGLAYLTISGYTSFGDNPNGPFYQFVNTYEISDSLTVNRGKHSMKFGFTGRLKLFHNQLNSNWGRGQEDFTGVFTRLPGFANTGSSIADFLLGTANAATYGNVTHEKDIWNEIGAYAQDKWLVTPKLTLSLGVRYFYDPPNYEARDEVSSVLFGPGYHGARVVVPQGISDANFSEMQTLFSFMGVERAPQLTRALVYGNHGFFAPRLGIAYQFSKKTVLRTGFGIFYGPAEQVGGNIIGVNPPSKLLVSSTTNGINPIINLTESVFGSNPFHTTLLNPNFFSVRDPYSPPEMTDMYNLSIQHEFAANWMLEVGYLGNHGSHILINTSPNDAAPALPTDNSSVQSRRIASPLLGNIPYFAPQGNSTYNAFTVNVEKRDSSGLTLLANYTRSRAIGNTDFAAQSPYDLRNAYGPLAFDVGNRASISAVYELPFGAGKALLSHVPRAINQIVSGWEINGVQTLQGGLRATPSLTFSLGKTVTNSRPDLIGDPIQGAAQQPYNWINPAAFAIPSNAKIAAGDFFGNSGVGVIGLPGMVNLDFSVLKSLAVKERVRVQFRTEFFNVLNTPFFGLQNALNTNFGTPTFGQITSAGDPRVIQLGLKIGF